MGIRLEWWGYHSTSATCEYLICIYDGAEMIHSPEVDKIRNQHKLQSVAHEGLEQNKFTLANSMFSSGIFDIFEITSFMLSLAEWKMEEKTTLNNISD